MKAFNLHIWTSILILFASFLMSPEVKFVFLAIYSFLKYINVTFSLTMMLFEEENKIRKTEQIQSKPKKKKPQVKIWIT